MSSILTRPRHLPPALVIFNHRAGEGARRRVERWLREAALPFDLVETRTADEGRTLARRCAEEDRLAVAAGGDGTVHSVANGLLNSGRTDPMLAVLPLGTGNDFSRGMGPRGGGLRTAIGALADPRLRRIDVGRTGDGEYFVNGLGVGFDAEVVRRRRDGRPSRWGYLPAVLRAVPGYRPRWYRIVWDEEELEGPAQLIAVMNGRSLGGGFRLTPDADPADGRLDICRIDPVGLATVLRHVAAVRRGRHTDLPIVRLWRTHRLRIRSDAPIQYEMDGEYREKGRGEWLEIEMEADRLQVVI